jgi:hypothetical protein
MQKRSLGPIGNVCDGLVPDGDSAMTVGKMSSSVKPATTAPPTMIRVPCSDVPDEWIYLRQKTQIVREHIQSIAQKA